MEILTKIGVGLSFYNDLESLKRGLPTYQKEVDYIFAIDGRYEYFNGEDYSNMETQEYIKSFPNVVYEKFVGMEHDKRQRYVDLAKDCDFLLIIDSDEYVIEADWDLFRKNCEIISNLHPSENFFGVDFRYTPIGYNPEGYSPYPRLWARPRECSYHKAHCIFKGYNGSPIRSSAGGPRITGLKLGLGDELRSQEYLQKISDYQKKMIEYEKPYRRNLLI